MPKKYAKLSEVREIIESTRRFYSEKLFPTPQEGDAPERFLAEGVRLACDNILRQLPQASVEE